ncbi:conserved membrane hypothetical protein [metagenome]|uniref:Uncharacterized protein n=1 Tax=metagenome TaxID=256318 RepID=A0A2P2C5N9_9ZZZZ
MTVRPTLHPLAESYLAELDRLLAGVDPAERHETLLGVREHIEAATSGDAGEEAVRRALAELGPPKAVADEAYAGRPQAGPGEAQATGGGLAIGVGLLQALALVIIVMVVGSGSGISESSTSSGAAGGRLQETVVKSWTGSVGIALVAFVFACFAWVPAALLASLSSLWTTREKRLQVALVPVAAILMGGLPELGYRLAGFGGIVAGAWSALVITVFGGGWLIVRLTRAGQSRAA